MAAFFTVFGMSFITALSGALQPGPLLAYTITETLRSPRRGWLTGARVVAGHAVLEFVLVVGILLGLSALLTHPVTKLAMGLLGTAVLVLLAVLTILDVFLKDVSLPSGNEAGNATRRGPLANPYLGGAFISMINPFWWIWWATLGFFFMQQYGVSLLYPLLFLAFFAGHEAGDLAWYMFVSVMAHTGRRWLGKRVYQGILIVIAAGLVVFAGYLFYSTIGSTGLREAGFSILHRLHWR